MSARDWLVGQFRRPQGAAGHLAGWVMGARPSNRRRCRWTLELLEIEPQHRVLEIGFGPGYAIARLVPRLESGRVLGLDHSKVMHRQASRRNAAAMRNGVVRLELGGIERLAALQGPFDRIFSANVAQFWPDRVPVFRDMLTLLAPGGRVATTYLPRHRGAGDRDALELGQRMLAEMREAGFARVELRTGPRSPVVAVSALGHAA